MKNFTGKVTDVDNNGNPIKKKSSGKNGKKSGFKKPAAVKKSSGKNNTGYDHQPNRMESSICCKYFHDQCSCKDI